MKSQKIHLALLRSNEMGFIRRCSILAGAITLTALPGFQATGQEQFSLADLIEQTEPSCVRIDVTMRDGKAIGSGFVVKNSNWVVTNHHVVAGATKATVSFSDGKTAEVEGFLAFAEKRDVAVLQIKTDRNAAPLKLVEKLPRKGEGVVAIGAPQGLSFTATEGIISAIRGGKELEEFGNDAEGTWLQTSTPISPGSSGGPLMNLKGEVVGANSGSLASAQNLNFAISAEDIAFVIDVASKSQVRELAKLDPSTAPKTTLNPKQIVCRLPAERKFRHRFQVAKEEDDFDQVTWLRTQWMPLTHNDSRLSSCALRVGVPYREDRPSPIVMWEVGTSSRHFAFLGPRACRFQLAFEGESLDLGNAKHEGKVTPSVTEKLTSPILLNDFLAVIMAKEVKARVGVMQYQLSDEHLECLRDLASKLPTGDTGIEEADFEIRIERYDLAEDPSIPATLASRLRSQRKSKLTAAKSPAGNSDPKLRRWTSADGKYSVVAKFVKIDGDKVHLQRKDNGQVVQVPLQVLSLGDQEFLESRQ